MASNDELKINGDKLVAIASGKGGVGKTWFAITLSHALARAGRRTLLFDGDLGLANVDIQLGLMPDRDLGAVLAGKLSMRQSVTKFDDGGFDIIAGRSGSGNLASLPAPRLNRLAEELARLSENYDHVIMDLGAGVDRTVQLLAGAARSCILVITEDPTSLTDAYAFIKVTRASAPDMDISIVVNGAETTLKGEKAFETLKKACQNFLRFEPKLSGVIRQDKHVREAIRKQIPLLTRSPGCEAAEDVERVARSVVL